MARVLDAYERPVTYAAGGLLAPQGLLAAVPSSVSPLVVPAVAVVALGASAAHAAVPGLPAAVAGACAASPSQGSSVFAVGERVLYWSDTYATWMDAVVQRVEREPTGTVCSYSLDIKGAAEPRRLRRDPRRGSCDLLEGELQIGAGPFDPTREPLRSRLVELLGLPAGHGLERLPGFQGGLNDGVWACRAGPDEQLVMKLVRCHRVASNVLTEAENFVKLKQEHPGLAGDMSVSFPVAILRCVDPAGTRRHDLIVMRGCPGQRLSEVIGLKHYAGQASELMALIERVGSSLCKFHLRYGNCQHGDFQPSNILVDEVSGAVGFVDIGGMGVPTMDTDVGHFSHAMLLLSRTYGAQLREDVVRSFERGYGKAAADPQESEFFAVEVHAGGQCHRLERLLPSTRLEALLDLASVALGVARGELSLACGGRALCYADAAHGRTLREAAVERGAVLVLTVAGAAGTPTAQGFAPFQPEPMAARSFAPGQPVWYWSETHAQWIAASVLGFRESEPACLDLDVKRSAPVKRVRLRAGGPDELPPKEWAFTSSSGASAGGA